MADPRETRELIDHILIVIGNDDLHRFGWLSIDDGWGTMTACAGREAAVEMLLPDIGSADQFAHSGKFCAHDRGQLLRRAADHIEAALAQPRPYRWILQGCDGGGVEPGDNLRRRLRRHQQRAPGHEAETWKRFGYGRDVRTLAWHGRP